jgi:hypothetical protein
VSVTYSWSAPVATPTNASAVVREALLPMLVWPSVPVVREIEERLTVIDRFVVEAAALMTSVTAADIAEVTGVPQDAVGRIAGRLVGLGLLAPADIGYAPTAEAAATLDRPSIVKRQPARLTFLYLPQGDDLIAYQDGPRRVEPPMVHRMPVETNFPLPPRTAGRRLVDFLRERIGRGQVIGLPEGIVDVVNQDQTLPLGCPAYRCAGAVVGTGTDPGAEVELRLHTASGRHFKLAGAVGQAAYWAAPATWTNAIDAVVADWTATGGAVERTQVGPTSWVLTVDGLAAAAATGVDLSGPAGLSIQADACVTYVDISFSPADHAARREFAMQDAQLRITTKVTDDLAEDAVAEAAAAARATYGLTEEDLPDAAIRDQLWRNGHYLHVYALRKDFVGYG